MKLILLPLVLAGLVASSTLSGAATINFSTTTTGNRVVTTTTPLSPVLAGSAIVMGSLANENDFTTFVEFGRSTVASNAAFTNGVISGGVLNNTAAASSFASKPIFIAIYDNASGVGATHGGLFKSTQVFDATISSSASQTFTLPVTTFTTALSPATGWVYGLATVNPAGTTGAAGNPPTDRTGMVFDLSPVPEAGSATLGMLAFGLLLGRRKR
jgi:hypothetical protein